MATTRSSSAAIALTGSMADTACEIPKLQGRDSLIAVAARSVPLSASKVNLPTPPNSISPSLPPHGLKARSRSSGHSILEAIESDLDIHDGTASSLASQGFESAGTITPALLAKHHLPEILLNNGPLAIRHIMGHLQIAVPGFSGIPPAKARRLVVSALEGRGSGGEGGGVDGDVKFEKVGWGRWDARQKGQATRQSRGFTPPEPSSVFGPGMPILNPSGRSRLDAKQEWAAESAAFSHDDDIDMIENEADKMSLDGGDESCSSSEAPDDEVMGMDEDIDDLTDDEDWSAIGAAALRQNSYSGAPVLRKPSVAYNVGSFGYGGISKSVPYPYRSHGIQREQTTQQFNFSALGMHTPPSQDQEREAIEALLRLGSV